MSPRARLCIAKESSATSDQHCTTSQLAPLPTRPTNRRNTTRPAATTGTDEIGHHDSGLLKSIPITTFEDKWEHFGFIACSLVLLHEDQSTPQVPSDRASQSPSSRDENPPAPTRGA